jgi:PAS domain S-box-containing protein
MAFDDALQGGRWRMGTDGPDLDRVIHGTLLGEAALAAEVAVLLADERGFYVAVNDDACELTGYARTTLVSFRAGELAADEASRAIYDKLMNREKLRGRKLVRRADGRVVQCRYGASRRSSVDSHTSSSCSGQRWNCARLRLSHYGEQEIQIRALQSGEEVPSSGEIRSARRVLAVDSIVLDDEPDPGSRDPGRAPCSVRSKGMSATGRGRGRRYAWRRSCTCRGLSSRSS